MHIVQVTTRMFRLANLAPDERAGVSLLEINEMNRLTDAGRLNFVLEDAT